MAKPVPLTRGQVAIVDDQDFDLVMKHKWHALPFPRRPGFYAARHPPWINGTRDKLILMHVQIMGFYGVDHRDGDGLNNQRENLRAATAKQNGANRCKPIGLYTSPYKGVHLRGGRWFATIRVDGKKLHLGIFDIEQDAARAYNAAALQAFGDFAKLNEGV